MVTTTRSSIHDLSTHILTALILSTCALGYAKQRDLVYRVTILLHVGGAPITGFLHSVNDSALTVIPGIGGRRAFEAASAHPQPITIPTTLIKKLIIAKVRPAGHVFLSSLGISAAYAIAYLALVPIEPTIGHLMLYTVTIGTASIVTILAIYTRKYKPAEPGFTIKMQKYCLVKTGIVADSE